VLDHPEAILDLHRRDVAAGADAVLTAGFGGGAGSLRRWGRAAEADRLQRQAVRLARAAAGTDRFVVGTVGPGFDPDEADAEAQALALAEEEVDAILLETFPAEPAIALAERLRPRLGVPLIVSLFDPGFPLDEAGRRLERAGVDAVGVNCQAEPAVATREIELLGAATRLPLWLKPGGGLPGRAPISPASFAAAWPAWQAAGVAFVGGCCGTTEAHTRCLALAVAGGSSASGEDFSDSAPSQSRGRKDGVEW
jgi:homocysteine S-methyltransferase